MSRLPRVLEVEHLGEHRLRLTFSDGLVRELDFSDAVGDWGGVLEPLCDPAFFAQAAVDPVVGDHRLAQRRRLRSRRPARRPRTGERAACHRPEAVPPPPDRLSPVASRPTLRVVLVASALVTIL